MNLRNDKVCLISKFNNIIIWKFFFFILPFHAHTLIKDISTSGTARFSYVPQCTLGWFKKTQFCGNQLLFHFLNLYVEKKIRKGCDLYDYI